MAPAHITSIHTILFSFIIFHINPTTSRPTFIPFGQIQKPHAYQAREPHDSQGTSALSLKDKLAIGISIGIVALLLIIAIAWFIWHKKRPRRRSARNNLHRGSTHESMQALPHHPLYKESLHPTSTNTPVNSPEIPQTTKGSPFLYRPYTPSPITSHFQPAEVYRALQNINDANGITKTPGCSSPPLDNSLARSSPKSTPNLSFSQPPSPKTIPKAREGVTDPVIHSTSYPTASPQTRHAFDLRAGPRRGLETGLGVTCPPQAMVRGRS